jgi:hypothetical protein
VSVHLKSLIALFVMGLFVWAHYVVITTTLGQPAGTTATFPDPLVYIASGAAGLVGAVFAIALGQKPPAAGAAGQKSMTSAVLSRAATKAVPAPWNTRVRTALTVAYVVAYLLVGLATMVVWVRRDETTPELVRNLALVFLGIVFAAAQSLMTDPPEHVGPGAPGPGGA